MADVQPHTPVSSAMFYAAIGIASVWWVALFALIALTSNPVTLNAVQLKQADFIVTATLSDSTSGKLEVEREWKQQEKITRLELAPQLFKGAETGSKWIIPLSRDSEGKFSVTQVIKENPDPRDDRPLRDAPYVYPLTGNSLQQLHDFLARP